MDSVEQTCDSYYKIHNSHATEKGYDFPPIFKLKLTSSASFVMTVLSKMAMISTTAAMSTTCQQNETTINILVTLLYWTTKPKCLGNIPATGILRYSDVY